MELRWYQQEALDAIYQYLRDNVNNPCVVFPTGGGKGNLIATLCRDAVEKWNGRVLVLTHVKELVDDTSKRIQKLCPSMAVGVYSAGMKRRDTTNAVIVAGIQSVYDKGDQLGNFDLVLIDEAHLVPDSGDGMYRQLLRVLAEINPDIRVIGLTATPYRLGSGPICTPDGILNAICYEVGVKTLIAQGYLCKLIGRSAVAHVDSSKLKIVRGEYDQDQVNDEFAEILEDAVREIIACTVDRKSVLIFTSSVEQGQAVANMLRNQKTVLNKQSEGELKAAESLFELLDTSDKLIAADWLEENGHATDATRVMVGNDYEVAEIYGDTKDRDIITDRFRKGEIKYLVNVNVLTTGFDAPNVDCICLLRSTTSPGLMYQMIGRAFRIHPEKSTALIMDFGENIKRHGPVDNIQPRVKKPGDKQEAAAKMCESCRSMWPPSQRICTDCGTEFPYQERERKPSFGKSAAKDSPVSEPEKKERLQIQKVSYAVHTKKDASEDTPKTLRVDYHVNLTSFVSEWICLEHTPGTFPHNKATKWWKQRCSFPMPKKAIDAIQFVHYGLLANCTEIETKQKADSRFPEITDYVLEPRPVEPLACSDCDTRGYHCLQPADQFPHKGKVVCGGCGRFIRWATSVEVERYGFVEDHDPATYKGIIDLGSDYEKLSGRHLFDTIQYDKPTNNVDSDEINDDDIPF